MGVGWAIIAENNRDLKRNFLFLLLERVVRSATPSYSVSPLIDSRSPFFSPILIQLSTRPRGESIVHTRDREKACIYVYGVSPCVFNAESFL